MHYRKRLGIGLVLVVLLGAGIAAGYFLGFSSEKKILDSKFNAIHPVRSNDTSYKFINPLLLYIIPSADEQWGLTPMKGQVQALIDQDKKTKGLIDASVFFQDSNLGRWMGVNQNSEYSPASMLKVVVMVAYYKKAETNPGILNQSLIYTEEIENFIRQDVYNNTSSLVVGKEYTVDELIKKMIIDSDNGAAYLLLGNISQTSLNSIYNALNIQNPDDTKDNFTISPRHYSFFFRILYSATYLNEQYSEKALNVLSGATFKEGIVGGIPPGMLVAHKYGEHISQENGTVKEIELHDCGIVYYPRSPYLLCVMTKGTNLENLKATIKSISSIVYKNYAALK